MFLTFDLCYFKSRLKSFKGNAMLPCEKEGKRRRKKEAIIHHSKIRHSCNVSNLSALAARLIWPLFHLTLRLFHRSFGVLKPRCFYKGPYSLQRIVLLRPQVVPHLFDYKPRTSTLNLQNQHNQERKINLKHSASDSLPDF